MTDQNLLAKVAIEHNDEAVRIAAVEKLNDQELLSNVIEHSDFNLEVRNIAFKKLTDQAMISKIALRYNDLHVRLCAIAKLVDQVTLAKIAIEDKDTRLRKAAVVKLTDQPSLAKVVVHDDDDAIRLAAVEKIDDQPTLAKVVVDDNKDSIRLAAFKKLTDQTLLAKVALESTSEKWRHLAALNLTNPVLLKRVGGKDADAFSYNQAVAVLHETDPSISPLSGDLSVATKEVSASIARVKLAIHNTCISSRMPGIVFEVRIDKIYHDYTSALIPITPGASGPKVGSMPGESVTFKLSIGGRPLAAREWHTTFPEYTKTMVFQAARVDGGEFFSDLFYHPSFAQEDLIELSQSEIPEVRYGAAAHLKDQPLLQRIADKDKDADVRKAARIRLKALVGK